MTRPENRERTMKKVKRVMEMWGQSAGGRDLPRVGKKSKGFDSKKVMADSFWWALSLYGKYKESIIIKNRRSFLGN
jgi:hypothetical protein